MTFLVQGMLLQPTEPALAVTLTRVTRRGSRSGRGLVPKVGVIQQRLSTPATLSFSVSSGSPYLRKRGEAANFLVLF